MTKVFYLLLTILISVGVSATQKSKIEISAASASEVENYVVPIQQSTVNLQDSKFEYQATQADFELTTSTWVPSNLSRPSLIENDGNFKSGNIPLIGINRVNSFQSLSSGVVESEFGFTYSQLLRNGTVSSGINTLSTTEKLNMVSLKIGVDYRFVGKSFKYIQPSVGIAVLPTWVSSEKSAFETYGVSATGLMYSTYLKLMYCPDFMQRGNLEQSGEGFGLAYLLTSGTVGGSDFAGAGIQAILRMRM